MTNNHNAFLRLIAPLLVILLLCFAPGAYASTCEVELIDENGNSYVVDMANYDGQMVLEDPEYLYDSQDEQPAMVQSRSSAAPQEAPPEANFDILIEHPTEWTNADSVVVTIKVRDNGGTGWQTIDVKMDGSSWNDISDKVNDKNVAKINVMRNGLLTVRIIDPYGMEHTQDTTITCFDESAPVVTAGVDDMLLHVETSDTQSGVAGIQVNGLLFTTLEDGSLDVRIKELLMEYEILSVRAFDYAGNFSDPVNIDNPYYSEPTAPPTATPQPTSQSSGNSNSNNNGNSNSSTATPTATPAPVTNTNQQIDINALLQSGLLDISAPAVTPEPEIQYVPVGPGQPFVSDGNMQTLDMLYSAATNKQFISVQTRAGETYYLIIDYDKPIDEENEIYETYFLNLVDDADLISVVGEEAMPTPSPTPQIVYVTPEPTQSTEVVPPKTNTNSPNTGLLLILVLLVGGVAIWFFKFKGKGNTKGQNEMLDEFDDYDEPEIPDADEGDL